MILPIYTYGEEILRKKSDDIDLDDVSLPSLIKNMYETMYNAKGAGLAGPQVGHNKRIIVIEEEISEGEIFKMVLLNPTILNYSGYYTTMTEGCLSFPTISAEVFRPLNIEVQWHDENKIHHKEFFTGIQSRILQHEIDHLNGVLFIDRIDPEKKFKLFKTLEDIIHKKIKTYYPIE